MKNNNLYSDILTSYGYNRSLLFDSLKNDVHFIDNEVYRVMSQRGFKNIPQNEIDALFYNYLVENDLILEVDELVANQFLFIPLEWHFAFAVSNMVIYVTKRNCELLEKIRESHFIAHFNFVFGDALELSSLDLLFEFIENHSCDSIELTFTHPMEKKLKEELKSRIKVIQKIIQFNDYENLELEGNADSEMQRFNRRKSIPDRLYRQLSRGIDHYAEAQNHQTYFNRKVFIDRDGTIKNAPETLETFGNIENLVSGYSLYEIISRPDFQKYWFVKKDQTDICKDCEFRYLCTDNRVPVKRNEHEWYHTVECGYNPYISLWDNEEGYKTLSDCGVVSNQDGFSIDKERIEEINRELWSEETEIE